MQRVKRSLVVSALLFFAGTGMASAEWVRIGENHRDNKYYDAHKHYYNTDGVEKHPGFNRVWIRSVYDGPTRDGSTSCETQFDFSHAKRQNRPFFSKYLNAKGETTRTHQTSKKKFKWYPVKPGTMSEIMWEACSKL